MIAAAQKALSIRRKTSLSRGIERMIVQCRREKLHWRAQKIRELLVRRLAGDLRIPAKSAVHAVLNRHGQVKVCSRLPCAGLY